MYVCMCMNIVCVVLVSGCVLFVCMLCVRCCVGMCVVLGYWLVLAVVIDDVIMLGCVFCFVLWVFVVGVGV